MAKEWELTDEEIDSILPTNRGGNEDDRNIAKAAQKKLVEWLNPRMAVNEFGIMQTDIDFIEWQTLEAEVK